MFSLVISVIALLVSTCVAIHSIRVQRTLAGTDHQAKEAVKSDTAKLLATVRSIVHKAAVDTEKEIAQKIKIDITPEKKAISDFINSSTGFAYRYWIYKKNLEAIERGNKDEHWRAFFLRLAHITSAESVRFAASEATEVDRLFDQMSENGISEIADFNSDLEKAISENAAIREGDIVAEAFQRLLDKKSTD